MSFLLYGVAAVVRRFANVTEAVAVLSRQAIRVKSDSPYVEYVIRGTAPHYIYPRTALALANPEKGFGPVAMVYHPGTKPNNFPAAAARKIKPLLIREFSAMVAESTEGGAARAQLSRITIGETILRAVREEAPKDTGALARGLGLVGQLGDFS
jgi:hypothetical protein